MKTKPSSEFRIGCIMTLLKERSHQAASAFEQSESNRMTCGLANGEAA